MSAYHWSLYLTISFNSPFLPHFLAKLRHAKKTLCRPVAEFSRSRLRSTPRFRAFLIGLIRTLYSSISRFYLFVSLLHYLRPSFSRRDRSSTLSPFYPNRTKTLFRLSLYRLPTISIGKRNPTSQKLYQSLRVNPISPNGSTDYIWPLGVITKSILSSSRVLS
jgi:hypothetical protein